MFRFNFITPQQVAVEFFQRQKKNISEIITEYQLNQRGVDAYGNKHISRSPSLDLIHKTYSAKYAVRKRKLGGDTTKFNLRLTGIFHKSFTQHAESQYVIIRNTNKPFLKERYPNLLKMGVNGINELIIKDLRTYTRIYILKHMVVRQ